MNLSRRDIELIKYLQKRTFSSDAIADSCKIPVEDVCKILNYPLNDRVNAHKDYNYYVHGWDEHDRLEGYAYYLQEGDFEKWQPVCYMDKNSDEFRILKNEAEAIPETNNPVMETRRMWVLMRFPEYQLKEWGELKKKFILYRDKMIEGLHEHFSN